MTRIDMKEFESVAFRAVEWQSQMFASYTPPETRLAAVNDQLTRVLSSVSDPPVLLSDLIAIIATYVSTSDIAFSDCNLSSSSPCNARERGRWGSVWRGSGEYNPLYGFNEFKYAHTRWWAAIAPHVRSDTSYGVVIGVAVPPTYDRTRSYNAITRLEEFRSFKERSRPTSDSNCFALHLPTNALYYSGEVIAVPNTKEFRTESETESKSSPHPVLVKDSMPDRYRSVDSTDFPILYRQKFRVSASRRTVFVSINLPTNSISFCVRSETPAAPAPAPDSAVPIPLTERALEPTAFYLDRSVIDLSLCVPYASLLGKSATVRIGHRD